MRMVEEGIQQHRLHKAGGGLIRDNITFTRLTFDQNTHNTELQMVKVHINNSVTTGFVGRPC